MTVSLAHINNVTKCVIGYYFNDTDVKRKPTPEHLDTWKCWKT